MNEHDPFTDEYLKGWLRSLVTKEDIRDYLGWRRGSDMGTPGLPAVALAAAGWRPSQPMPPLRNALARCGACRRARGKVEPKHNGGDEFG